MDQKGEHPPKSVEENILLSFPFKSHVPREGEPPFPILEIEIRNPLEDFGSEAYQTTDLAYADWIDDQPDHMLLMEEKIEKDMWIMYRGKIKPDAIENNRNVRWKMAEELRQEGHGDILDKYWPNNEELRTPPVIKE